MKKIFLANLGHPLLFEKIIQQSAFASLDFNVKTFPDSEILVQLNADVQNAHVWILTSLYPHQEKILPLLFLAQLLKEKGCRKVSLLAPYLAYMRQDMAFHPGEAVTSKYFAKLLSQYFDALVTVDPHLHRYQSLSEIYTMPTQVLHADTLLADWLQQTKQKVLLVGPDAESEQWVSAIAKLANLPYTIFHKTRKSAYEVAITTQDLGKYRALQPVLVDDMITTGHTLIKCSQLLQSQQLLAPWCLAVHGLFTGQAWAEMQAAGIKKIVTTNSIAHDSNQIDLSTMLAHSLKDFIW